MTILLCPDKFKGSLSAQEVGHSLRKGLLSIDSNLDIINHPMADGGDGSIDILQSLLDLIPKKVQTVDPLSRKIEATYYISADMAYIELASASGIVLLDKEEQNPMMTSTLGTGLMIKDAIDSGIHKINLFIGGSATNDGGIGIAHAIGYRFLAENGDQLEPIGANLGRIHTIAHDSPNAYKDVKITVLCDVSNPMYGPSGAAYVYGPQKGATPEEVLILDSGLSNYAAILRSQIGVDLKDLPGIGAAGAVSASLVGLLNARLENGFQMLANYTGLENAINNADLVITGEGKIDSTSFQGKVVGNVLKLCKKYDKPCGIVCGIIEELNPNIDFKFNKSILTLSKDLNEAMAFPKKFLFDIGQEIGRHL